MTKIPKPLNHVEKTSVTPAEYRNGLHEGNLKIRLSFQHINDKESSVRRRNQSKVGGWRMLQQMLGLFPVFSSIPISMYRIRFDTVGVSR